MGFSFLLFMLAMAVLLVFASIATVSAWRLLPKPNKPIKHSPTELWGMETWFKATAKKQAELLVAGDTVLAKLPTDIRDCLSAPILCDLAERLSQGGNPEDLTPERVRAALAVNEVSLAIWTLMFDFGSKVNQSYHQVVFDERAGILTIGKQEFVVRYIILRISRATGVSFAVAIAMWHSIVEILREGLVSVPGIRAVKPRV